MMVIWSPGWSVTDWRLADDSAEWTDAPIRTPTSPAAMARFIVGA